MNEKLILGMSAIAALITAVGMAGTIIQLIRIRRAERRDR